MQPTRLTVSEIVRRGQALCGNEIRPKVEGDNEGKFLVINLDAGEYDLDSDDLAAVKRAKSRFPMRRSSPCASAMPAPIVSVANWQPGICDD